MTIILGIDPGSRKLGYGLIQSQNQKLVHIDNGILEIPISKDSSNLAYLNNKSVNQADIPQRLGFIYSNLDQIISKYKPKYFAIEEVFVHKNVSSALKLGQARGAAILAAVNNNIPVFEFSARAVKKAITGTGSADKFQMQHMVKVLLALGDIPKEDAADALAIAICMANHSIYASNNKQIQKSSSKYSRGRWR